MQANDQLTASEKKQIEAQARKDFPIYDDAADAFADSQWAKDGYAWEIYLAAWENECYKNEKKSS